MTAIQGELALPDQAITLPDHDISFGRVVKHPELMGFEMEDYTIPSPDDIDRVQHRVLDRSLHGVRYGRFVCNQLSFTPEDYAVIPRSYDALRSKASGGVYLAHAEQDIEPSETDAAADRSELHLVRQKREKLVEWRDTLRDRRDGIQKLQAQIRTPGYAHLNKSEWEDLLRSVFTGTFSPMLEAAALRNRWPLADLDVLRPALAFSLMGPEKNLYRGRMQAWRDMSGLAMKYTVLRGRLANEKITEADEILAVEEPVAKPA